MLLPARAAAPSNSQASPRATAMVVRRRSVITVVLVLVAGFFVFVLVFLLKRIQLQRRLGDHFEVPAALRARHDFTLVELFFVKIEVGFAFRANCHFLPPGETGSRDYI